MGVKWFRFKEPKMSGKWEKSETFTRIFIFGSGDSTHLRNLADILQVPFELFDADQITITVNSERRKK